MTSHPPDPAPTDRLAADLTASDYLSAPSAAAELRSALALTVDPALVAAAGSAERVLLVGSGGSYAALLTAQYLLEQATTTPVHVLPGLDVVWREPAWLGPRTLVIFVSWSGNTTDVVAALRLAQQRGCVTVGITGRPGSTLATETAHPLLYDGVAIYEVPIALVLRLLAPDHALVAGLAAVPPVLDAATVPGAEGMVDRMRAAADTIAATDHLYVTGSGPLSSLAFKLAPVFMENVRIGASYLDGSEFRHGPIEFLERHRPTVLALLGTDASRETTAMIINFVVDRGGQCLVLDVAELAPAEVVDPLLAPLVINSWTQWLVAWSAVARGITDLDERVYMGKGLLSKGQWP